MHFLRNVVRIKVKMTDALILLAWVSWASCGKELLKVSLKSNVVEVKQLSLALAKL